MYTSIHLPLPIYRFRSTCWSSFLVKGIMGATWNAISCSFHSDTNVNSPASPTIIQSSIQRSWHTPSYFLYPIHPHSPDSPSAVLYDPKDLGNPADCSINQCSSTKPFLSSDHFWCWVNRIYNSLESKQHPGYFLFLNDIVSLRPIHHIAINPFLVQLKKWIRPIVP